MPVTNTPDGVLKHVEGSRTVWAANYQPVVLLPESKVTLTNFDIAFPHFQTANAYAFNEAGSQQFPPFGATAAMSVVTVVPQEWDSGLSGSIAAIPSGCNYFQVDVNLSRVAEPSTFMGSPYAAGQPIPKLIPEGVWMTLDGDSALVEQASSMRRLFRFERVGNGIYLRRKQSVHAGGARFSWNPDNSPTFPNGGQRQGWTYSGTLGILGWPFYIRDYKMITQSGRPYNRGQSEMLPVDDNSNFSSTWRGTVVITPGYIKS